MSEKPILDPPKQFIRLKVLLPMSIGLLVFLGLYVASTSWYLNREIYRDLAQNTSDIDRMFHNLVDQHADLMRVELQKLAANTTYQQLMQQRDRDALYASAAADFKLLKEQLNISHFYFISPDKTVFLRMHSPSRYGDRISRHTLRQASQTGEAAQGIELGPLGTFTLRVVLPWRHNGELLGYLELGQEIELLIKNFLQREHTEIFFTVDKQLLSKEQLELSAQTFGKNIDWNFFSNRVILQASNPEMLPALRRALEEKEIHPAHSSIELEHNGRHYQGLGLPLRDSSQRTIGEFLVLSDVTDELTDFQNAVKFFAVLCLVLGSGFLLFASIVLGNTEVDLETTRKKLVAEMHKVRESNQQLATEIDERKAAQNALSKAHDELEDRVQERTEQLWLSLEQTRQARKQLTSIVTSVADGLLVTSPEGRLQLINASAEQLFDCREEECLNQPLMKIIKDPALCKRMEEALAEELPDLRIEFTQMSKDLQKPIFLQARTSVLSGKHGEITGMIFLIQDISHEREIERMKSEFISTAVHELSTPLTAIMGYSELLLSGQQFPPEETREFLSIINEKSEFLTGLVGEMLDISRIESGKPLELRKNSYTVSELFERPIHHFRHFSENHRFTVELNSPEYQLPADREKIWQVMENLCSNAVKYSPAGGEISVKGAPIDKGYQLTVTDQGIGMTREQQAKVFEKFYRCNQSDTSVGGTGLGMTIVKSIIEAHDGQIWLDSELGQGTTVHIVLPNA